MSRVLHEHRTYLDDPVRLKAFRSAIDRVVRPGDVVVDLGSGTGVLGMLACRAGAARVYSIEESSLIGLTRQLARANGLVDRITFIKEHSQRAKLPEPADVVVADQLVGFGFEAGLFEYFADARERFLKPAGVTIPRGVDFVAVPVEAPSARAAVDFWGSRPASFDFTPVSELAQHTIYSPTYEPSNLLSTPRVLASLDPGRRHPTPLKCSAKFTIERPGTLHGIGGWFSAELAEGVTLTTSPLAVERLDRYNTFLPLQRSVDVDAGDWVALEMDIVTAAAVVGWSVDVTTEGGASKGSFRHSTARGMFLAKEDLRRLRPDYAPALSLRGAARLAALEMCDGTRHLAAIEAEIHRKFPDLFRSPREAAAFVAEVLPRNTD